MSPVIHREFAQHSPEWDAIRAGKWTASNAAKIMGKPDTQGLKDLIKSVAWGRVFGAPDEPHFQSAAMQRGNEMEAEARDWYAFERDRIVGEVGFVEHGSVPHCGWSPDGLHHDDERHGIEVKCLLHKAWMDVRKSGQVPAEYRWQCRWAMWVGELSALDFIAYHPQGGAIVIPCEIGDDERDQMTARVALLEPLVSEWIDIITNNEEAA